MNQADEADHEERRQDDEVVDVAGRHRHFDGPPGYVRLEAITSDDVLGLAWGGKGVVGVPVAPLVRVRCAQRAVDEERTGEHGEHFCQRGHVLLELGFREDRPAQEADVGGARIDDAVVQSHCVNYS